VKVNLTISPNAAAMDAILKGRVYCYYGDQSTDSRVMIENRLKLTY